VRKKTPGDVKEKTISFRSFCFYYPICSASLDESFDVVGSDYDYEVLNDANLEYVFDLEALPSIVLHVFSNDWNTLLTNFDANENNKENIPAIFSFDKDGTVEIVSNIAIRIRGYHSRVRPEGSTGQLTAEPRRTGIVRTSSWTSTNTTATPVSTRCEG
jgi:hypothetical protein